MAERVTSEVVAKIERASASSFKRAKAHARRKTRNAKSGWLIIVTES